MDPAPDGGYPNFNTAEGTDALFSLTSGFRNTAMGFNALHETTTGSNNTANGASALVSNTIGNNNTATGDGALIFNNANNNTANGFQALQSNTTGNDNTANGVSALFSNTDGFRNTASGFDALFSNTDGTENAASGWSALFANTTGGANTASGFVALNSNTTGSFNTAIGGSALQENTTGSNNIAVGADAGFNLTTGNNNIDIGHAGFAGEAGKIRIGTKGTHKKTFIAGISGATVAGGVAVIVNSNGQLGTVTSSERFKDEIKPMDKASEAILALQPVTFRYKHELDPEGIPQFGLVAEQVENVNPDLVVRDDNGDIYTVRYEAVNAMLLNKFLKEHRKVQDQGRKEQELEATIAQQQKEFRSIVAQQQKEIKALTASLKEQAARIQKVSDQLELSKPAPQMVVSNQ